MAPKENKFPRNLRLPPPVTSPLDLLLFPFLLLLSLSSWPPFLCPHPRFPPSVPISLPCVHAGNESDILDRDLSLGGCAPLVE
ncbi:uncharacterized protein G2W53_032224 [Senna tora]|uniref:Uncharacterized protein n=1 Tax=Senna tora TaxID=362788 RepID=A0A834W7H6_9FABA|nr:uncharacterized protein G2W53_032224 [Senna tora]